MRIFGVTRGKLRPVKFEYRVVPTITGGVLLWLIPDDYWGGSNEDDEPGWQCVASFSAEMPFTETIVPDIVDKWFKFGCKELKQDDIEDMVFRRVWSEAHSENREWDRVRTHRFAEALIGDQMRF